MLRGRLVTTATFAGKLLLDVRIREPRYSSMIHALLSAVRCKFANCQHCHNCHYTRQLMMSKTHCLFRADWVNMASIRTCMVECSIWFTGVNSVTWCAYWGLQVKSRANIELPVKVTKSRRPVDKQHNKLEQLLQHSLCNCEHLLAYAWCQTEQIVHHKHLWCARAVEAVQPFHFKLDWWIYIRTVCSQILLKEVEHSAPSSLLCFCWANWKASSCMTKAKLYLRCEGWAKHKQSCWILSIHRSLVPIHVPSRWCAVTSYAHLDLGIQWMAGSFWSTLCWWPTWGFGQLHIKSFTNERRIW